MDNPIIFQVLAALVVLFFIYLTYMNTKTWRWLHVTMLFLVFVASFAFCVYAAMTLKTRAKWIKDHDTLEKQLADTERQLELTTRGDPNDVEGKTDSLFSLREQLARVVLDRGRVWSGCVPNINRQTGAVAVQTSPPADPNNPTPTPPKKHNIQAKTIVHAFREAEFRDPQNPEKVTIVPASYIGEFRATPINDQAVGLEPTMPPLAPEQLNAGLAPGTWALYETMPVDGHQWFVGEKPEQRAAAILGAAQVSGQFDRAPLPQPLLDQLIAPYVKDGQPATDTDPPENIWYEVKFDQEFELVVDAPVVNSVDAEPFNTEGQAVQPRLRRQDETPEDAGKVVFGPKEGQIQTAILDQQTVESLFERGICKREEAKKIYRRKLTDYERKFRSIKERTVEIDARKTQLDLDNKAMLAATAKAQEQQKLVEELKGKVNEDLGKVRYESTELEKYLTALGSRLTAVQTELSQLYRSNKAISRELAELTTRLTDEIDRRSGSATALAP
jgi:hypothetical protein